MCSCRPLALTCFSTTDKSPTAMASLYTQNDQTVCTFWILFKSSAWRNHVLTQDPCAEQTDGSIKTTLCSLSVSLLLEVSSLVFYSLAILALKTMTNFLNKKRTHKFPHQNWIPASAKSRIKTRSKFTSTFWTLAPAWLHMSCDLRENRVRWWVGKENMMSETNTMDIWPQQEPGKGSTVKQYLIEVCSRGIDAASLYISIVAKTWCIYPGKTIFKTHANHHSWCQLDIHSSALHCPKTWQWHIINKFTIYHTVCKLYDVFSACKSQQPCEIQRQPTCVQPILKTKRIMEDLILKNTTCPRLFSS